jgi:hypothetical protein
MSSQRVYLQELCNKFGDFKVCHAWIDLEGERHFSKWNSVLECWESEVGLKFLDLANNRQIQPDEIVIDIEDPAQIQSSLKKLEELGWTNAAVWKTGSRGWHIHAHFLELAERPLRRRNQLRAYILKTFFPQADAAKANESAMIALEGVPHWKTGILKQQVLSWQ